MADWIANHDGKDGVLATVNANKAAIDLLNDKTGKDGSIQKIVSDAIAAIPAVPVATLTTAGIVKASSEISVAEDGTMSISSVSTDAIVQGSATLVLNGGTSEE